MGEIRQKVPFVLASCAHGTVILNRLDWRRLSDTHNEFGVGTGILVEGSAAPALLPILCTMLRARRERAGSGVMALDCGANIGTFTLEFGREMEGWGMVLAFEPQERIYYALAGNIAINNLFNVRAFHKAVGDGCASIVMPVVDYQIPGQFGGLSLKGDGSDIGQRTAQYTSVDMLSIDSLGLQRIDFIKIDVEGMEVDVLEGARAGIAQSAPYIFAEHHLCGKDRLEHFMESINYESFQIGLNLLCAPRGDEVFTRIRDKLAAMMAEAGA